MSAALPTVTKEILGVTYEITMLDGIECSDLYFKIIGAAGEAMTKIGAIKVDKISELPLQAIGAVMSALPPELLRECRTTFAKSTRVVLGEKSPKLSEVFGPHFAGKPAAITMWLYECAKVNFADFLDSSSGLGAMLAPMLAKVPGSKSPTDSTGSSTG